MLLDNLIYSLIAIVAVFGVLRILDLMTGVKFRDDVLPVLKTEPMALAVFRGCWVIGACLLVGRMLGVG